MNLLLQLNTLLFKKIFFYRYLYDNFWQLGQLMFILFWIYLIKYRKISGKKTAIIGFALFTVMMFLNMLGLDDQAGLVGQYVFILFCVSFIQEFYHFLKHENK